MIYAMISHLTRSPFYRMKYILCSCTFFWFVAVCLTVDDTKELRLSENCKRRLILCASRSADECGRYSNTLLVNLNNRIYFREHDPPGLGDSACLTVSNRIRAMALSSLNLRVVPEPQTQAPKGVIFPLNPLSQPGSLDYTSSTDLSQVRAFYLTPMNVQFLNSLVSVQPNPTSRISLTPPQDLEWRTGTSPLFCGSQEEIGS